MTKFLTITLSFMYIMTAIMGFILPTREWYEIAIRLMFLFIGFVILMMVNYPRTLLYVLRFSLVLLISWILFGYLIILKLPENSLTRVHLFYMHFWVFWAVIQGWTINQLKKV